MPRQPDIALLDWDHTLHDATWTFFEALRVVMARRGHAIDEAAYRAAYDPDPSILYRRLGLAVDEVPGASAEWRELVVDQEPRLLPGAMAGLEALREAGMLLGVVTAGARPLVERQLDRVGLAWLDVLVAGGESAVPRPNPAPVLLALQRLADAAPLRAAYVGDTPADMQMGRAAGVWSVGVASFASGEEALRAAGADETAPSFGDWAARRLDRGW
ncbi:MAG: HAD family hydrolase [Chloroflexi bacterium]|nr:HAD family hydrolase [Chloroflexota bacterium]